MTHDNEPRCVLNWYNDIKQKGGKKSSREWVSEGSLFWTWLQTSPARHVQFNLGSLRSALRHVCMRRGGVCHVAGGRLLVSWLSKAEHLIGWTPHHPLPCPLPRPGGVYNRYTSACFPYQNSSWTLNDTVPRFMVDLYHFGAVNSELPDAIPHVEQRRKIFQWSINIIVAGWCCQPHSAVWFVTNMPLCVPLLICCMPLHTALNLFGLQRQSNVWLTLSPRMSILLSFLPFRNPQLYFPGAALFATGSVFWAGGLK